MEYRRNRQMGGSYFFTVVTHSRRPILIEHIERLREAFRHTRRRYPFEIDVIVVLSDHLYTISRLPAGDHDYPRRWMVLKRKFSAGLEAVVSTTSQQKKR
ncbi:MAG: transposase, partial [Gammaproteobacteria bacterium]|nr:transposase [Gammaproteobacteria bacterium]